jgi:excisionase family DNA binding protein
MADHELLTPEEAARYLRVNPQTVYRLLRGGRCPGVKIGRQWRIRKADLDAHLCGQSTLAGNVVAASLVEPADPASADAIATSPTQ